jgi:uncharacterized membrane protein YsdA (DUF1294 family)
VLAWLFAGGLVGFAAMWVDKSRAVNHKWRIPESSFFALAFLGGFWGILVGEPILHHKTLKLKFTLIVLSATALWLVALSRVGFLECLLSSI